MAFWTTEIQPAVFVLVSCVVLEVSHLRSIHVEKAIVPPGWRMRQVSGSNLLASVEAGRQDSLTVEGNERLGNCHIS